MAGKTDKLSGSELESYYRKEPKATEQAILSFLRDSRGPRMIVYGSKAINAHLPAWLDKETGDWDIFTETDPKVQARRLEEKLDKRYGGNFFRIEPAIHPSTFRIKSNVTGNVVADVSFRDRTVTFKRIAGVNYASLDWLEKEAKETLSDPDDRFRWHKDRDTLQRIQVYKRTRGKRRAAGDEYIDGSPVDTSMRGLRL